MKNKQTADNIRRKYVLGVAILCLFGAYRLLSADNSLWLAIPVAIPFISLAYFHSPVTEWQLSNMGYKNQYKKLDKVLELIDEELVVSSKIVDGDKAVITKKYPVSSVLGIILTDEYFVLQFSDRAQLFTLDESNRDVSEDILNRISMASGVNVFKEKPHSSILF